MLTIISFGKSSKNTTAEVILSNGGQNKTKHLVKDKKSGVFFDGRGIPYPSVKQS